MMKILFILAGTAIVTACLKAMERWYDPVGDIPAENGRETAESSGGFDEDIGRCDYLDHECRPKIFDWDPEPFPYDDRRY